MPDYPIPPARAPLLAGPQFPFSRALTSGPLGDLLAGVVGAPGDFQTLITPRPNGLPSAGSLAPAQLPTMATINRAQEQQNAAPAPLSYQSIYAMLPELAMTLRGAPTPESVPSWLKDQSWLAKILGGAPTPPPQSALPDQPTANPDQGWTLEKMFKDLIGGSKPAY